MITENCTKCGKPIALVSQLEEQITMEAYNNLEVSIPNIGLCLSCQSGGQNDTPI